MEINIVILKIFKLAFGSVYLIKFPKSFIPTNGITFILNDHILKIAGININSSREKDQEENSWDCMLESTEDVTVLKEGSYRIRLIESDAALNTFENEEPKPNSSLRNAYEYLMENATEHKVK